MSLILFPPKRSSENLVYLILPLGVATLYTAVFNKTLSEQNGLALALLGVSIGALFLYMIEPLDILLRNILRWQTSKKNKDLLYNAFKNWFIKLSTPLPKDGFDTTVKTMINNAVSSYPIRLRTIRIRGLVYFIGTFWFYFFAIYIYLDIDVSWVVGIGILVWIFMMVLLMKRRIYASYLLRDISYVAEFTFAMIHLQKWASGPATAPTLIAKILALQEKMKFADSLLVRDDLDFFAITWGNTMSKMKSA